MSAPIGLYGWIRSNDGRSTGLFIGFLLAMQLVAAVVLFLPLTILDIEHAPVFGGGGYLLRYAPLVLAASILWFGAQFFWHMETVKRAVGFHFVDATDEPRLCRVIEPLIIMTGLPVPFVAVIESPARNAFACGIARKKAVVVVTRGLLESLDDEELAGVLGHEVSHIKNGDIRLMAAANIFMIALARLHRDNPLRFGPLHVVLAIGIPAVLPIALLGGFLGHLALRAGQVSRLLIASSREFIADAEAIQLTKNPAALASALVKVEHDYRVQTARREDDAMMIAGDTEGADATHPTVTQRIGALARTTGSMVFNAPGAPKLPAAEAAALLRKLPPARALPRVNAAAQENWLGLSMPATVMVVATVGALVGLHWNELHDRRAIAAKFDVRPIALVLGVPIRCHAVPILGGSFKPCQESTSANAYRDFTGQKNTLAGWLAHATREMEADGGGLGGTFRSDAMGRIGSGEMRPVRDAMTRRPPATTDKPAA